MCIWYCECERRESNFLSDTSFADIYHILTYRSNIIYTIFDLIGAWGAYVNLFSTTSARLSSSIDKEIVKWAINM